MANGKKKTVKKKTKKYRDPRETLTLKYWLIGALIVAIFVGAGVLLSILLAGKSVEEFTYSNGILTRVRDGRIYQKADEPFEVLIPISNRQDGTPYGECESFKIYKVGYINRYDNLKEMDKEHYLTDGVSFYFSQYVPIPTLENFKADTVRLGEVSADDKHRVYLTSFTEADAEAFVNEYLVGKSHDTAKSRGVYTYCVQLTSAEHYYLSYILYAVECEDGSWYMYSKSDRTAVSMDPSWFKDLKTKVEGTDDTTAAETTVTEEPSAS